MRHLLPIAFSALALAALSPTVAGAATFTPGAFAHYDFTVFDTAPVGFADTDGWRRLRLSLDVGDVGPAQARLQYDFESQAFTDALLRWPLAGGTATLGQFKPPFSHDALTSDGQAFFTEASVAASFAPGRRLGAQYARSGWTVAVYGRDLSGSGPDAALAARYAGDGAFAGDGRWHLGVATVLERPQGNRTSLSLRPEVGPDNPAWLASGSLDAQRAQRIGLEAGLQRGNWLLFGERLRSRYTPASGPDRHANGGYLTAAWTVHGSPRVYRRGLFTEAKGVPGRLGNVEMVVRHAWIGIPQANGDRLRQRGLSLGLNAQFGEHWRLQLDRHASERRADGADAVPWTLRVQWAL